MLIAFIHEVGKGCNTALFIACIDNILYMKLKERDIQQLQAEIVTKDHQIQQLRTEVGDRDRQLRELQRMIAAQDQHLQRVAKDERLQQLKREKKVE